MLSFYNYTKNINKVNIGCIIQEPSGSVVSLAGHMSFKFFIFEQILSVNSVLFCGKHNILNEKIAVTTSFSYMGHQIVFPSFGMGSSIIFMLAYKTNPKYLYPFSNKLNVSSMKAYIYL